MRKLTDLIERPFEARYSAFLETMMQLRPLLHRYCARMTGSVMDGEDVVQEALFEAYRKLDKFDESRPVKPWLFRIAHNRCVDFLRRVIARDRADSAVVVAEEVLPTEPSDLGRALKHLVLTLPANERACILLKDVFDYSLEEIADIVGSTTGGVKSALNRARTKLAASTSRGKISRPPGPELTRMTRLYIERFNRRDWDGMRELIRADARLNVADAYAGKVADAPYFSNWGRWSMPRRLACGEVDGESAVIILQRGPDTWIPYPVVRLRLIGGQIQHISDYAHCPWVISSAESISIRDFN
jgi:RNA polymerase sigma-70 factor, ECF subfamily